MAMRCTARMALRMNSGVRVASALALLCLAMLAGCNALRLTPQAAEKPGQPAKEPALAAPSKHALRVSQFVFLYDFDLKRDLPIFKELSDLREQVYKELSLPPASAVVQVYLFEDRERYERFMKSKYPDLPRRRAFFVAQPHGVGAPED